ncbi:MAG: hypothetical protein KAX81_02130, partial [Leadbetterella sp.]|nr:hypothetical protein [Leadbetterella sp.]
MAKRKIDILKRLGLIIGPCTDYDFTQIDKTREYWQELYLKRVETRKKILSTAGIETTLENIHNKG